MMRRNKLNEYSTVAPYDTPRTSPRMVVVDAVYSNPDDIDDYIEKKMSVTVDFPSYAPDRRKGSGRFSDEYDERYSDSVSLEDMRNEIQDQLPEEIDGYVLADFDILEGRKHNRKNRINEMDDNQIEYARQSKLMQQKTIEALAKIGIEATPRQEMNGEYYVAFQGSEWKVREYLCKVFGCDYNDIHTRDTMVGDTLLYPPIYDKTKFANNVRESVRLTESQLHNIIRESVRRILKEEFVVRSAISKNHTNARRIRK